MTGSVKLEYLHRDHLGSVDVITDELGAVVQRMSFDAFGKRRETNWTAFNEAAITNFNTDITTRGFTGHEQIDAVGLVHMNGRVYEPEIGRFLSADPIVEDIENLQTYNRYSYVRNNPLTWTDPSGFESDGTDGGNVGDDSDNDSANTPTTETNDPGKVDVAEENKQDNQQNQTAARADTSREAAFAQRSSQIAGQTSHTTLNANHDINQSLEAQNKNIGPPLNTKSGKTAVATTQVQPGYVGQVLANIAKGAARGVAYGSRGGIAGGILGGIIGGIIGGIFTKGNDETQQPAEDKQADKDNTENLVYEPNPKHGKENRNTSKGVASKAPTDPEQGLKASVPVKSKSTSKRGAVNKEAEEYQIFHEHEKGKFHGYAVNDWAQVPNDIKAALGKAGLVNPKNGKFK